MSRELRSRNRTRSWVFTWNNYTEQSEQTLKDFFDEKCIYMIYGKEVGPKSGTPHLQGYLRGKNQISFKTMKLMLPKCHIEPAFGSVAQNVKYTSKDDNVTEYGQRPRRTYTEDVYSVRRRNQARGKFGTDHDQVSVCILPLSEWDKRSLIASGEASKDEMEENKSQCVHWANRNRKNKKSD